MIVVPNNGVTTTQRPLLKIRLDVPLPIGAQLQVLRGETVIGTATLATDQQGEPGLHYEFRHVGISAGTYQYSVAVVIGAVTNTSPLYTIEVVPLVLPTVTGVYEQETIESGIFLYCPVFPEAGAFQYHDFGIRIVITPDEPSGEYPVTSNADASAELLNLGLVVQHLEGNLTIVEMMASQLQDNSPGEHVMELIVNGNQATLRLNDADLFTRTLPTPLNGDPGTVGFAFRTAGDLDEITLSRLEAFAI